MQKSREDNLKSVLIIISMINTDQAIFFFIIQQLQESLSKSKKMEDELRQEITRLMEELQKPPHELKVSYFNLNYKNISKKCTKPWICKNIILSTLKQNLEKGGGK